jgi:hypothetical protein
MSEEVDDAGGGRRIRSRPVPSDVQDESLEVSALPTKADPQDGLRRGARERMIFTTRRIAPRRSRPADVVHD